MAVKTPYRLFTAAHGVTFAVRYLPVGTRYGRGNRLTIEDAATVEFWDTRWADDGDGDRDGFGPLGQFVSRYHAWTLLDRTGAVALCLDGGVPAWQVDGATMDEVCEWVATLPGAADPLPSVTLST